MWYFWYRAMMDRAMMDRQRPRQISHPNDPAIESTSHQNHSYTARAKTLHRWWILRWPVFCRQCCAWCVVLYSVLIQPGTGEWLQFIYGRRLILLISLSIIGSFRFGIGLSIIPHFGCADRSLIGCKWAWRGTASHWSVGLGQIMGIINSTQYDYWLYCFQWEYIWSKPNLKIIES